MKFLTVALTAVLALMLVGSASAGVLVFSDTPVASAANPAPAGSTGLGLGGAVGGIGGAVGFTMPFDGLFTLTVTDCCIVGDVYQAFIDGVSMGFTSPVAIGGPTGSSGSFTEFLFAGAHTYDINDQILSYIGFAGPYGGNITADFSPAGLGVTGTATPEPGTLALFGIGLVGAGLLRRRRA